MSEMRRLTRVSPQDSCCHDLSRATDARRVPAGLQTTCRGFVLAYDQVLPMSAIIPLVKEAQVASPDATKESRRSTVSPPRAGTLVARGYGRRDYILRRLLVFSDASCLAMAMVLSMWFTSGVDGHSWHESLLYCLLTLPGWVVLFKLYGLYERDAKRLSHSTVDDLPSLFHVFLLGCLLMWCWFIVAVPFKLVFATILTFGGLALALVLVGRAATRASVVRAVAPERVLLIGTGLAAGVLIEKMRASKNLRLEPVGVVSPTRAGPPAVDLPLLGCLEDADLTSLMLEHNVGRVVVADAEVHGEQLLEVLRDCKNVLVKVSLLPATFSVLGPSVEVDDVQGVTVLGVNPPVLARSSRVAKRLLDLVGAVILSVLTAPLMVVMAVAIKLDSSGPVFFRQERIGKGGQRFRLLKLRTMVADAEAKRRELLSQSKDAGWLHLDDDPRITRVGRVLRRASLDELPQLWNVLTGDMSLVGPRPLIAEEDGMVEGWARGRLDLTPGVSGLWQVLGRTKIPFDEMVKLDYLYVTNWSLWGDIRLILRTLPVVLKRHGAN